ncbi:putative MFS siderophore iron transporter [Polychaeton citri CBS 116435]|uniref:MFS siderophore iron transporter n=1 Tax=Polychaeton citri CBS 116435 TaxID=1314669 RepID=A0A9P4URM0_9PEZI|nr:putative MFS siderophore iron transporter [Polychaeton citri CBS 116435]
MAIFSKSPRPTFRRATTDDVGGPVERDTTIQLDKSASATGIPTASNSSSHEQHEQQQELPDQDAQRGVKAVEAITLSWSKKSLIAVFLNIWMLYLVNSFQSTVVSALNPYATSAFEAHSLLNVIPVVSNAIAAACYIPISKILDVWGRAEGFAFMALCATLGLVMTAASNSLVTYCAGNVFYTLGFSAMTYCVDVITADASTLRNRGLAYAFTSSPYIITAVAGPRVGQDFYDSVGWRWGIGCWAIIFPVVAAPLPFILKSTLRKAEKQGFAKRQSSGRTFWQSIWFYVVDFDLLGVILFSGGLTVFLLPFSIADSAPNGWASGYIIAMLVVGFVVLIGFGLYEVFLCPKPMFNGRILADRTVIGACALDATYQVSWACWSALFTSFLQVVNNLSVADANYVNNTFNVVSGVLLLLVGYLIRKTGHFKWLLYIAVPLYMLAQGLMIYFRRPNQTVGYQVMCQIFISMGGSVFIIIEQVAILAAVDHQHVATALALLNVIGTVGGAIGAAISGAIWTNTFYKALETYLPESALPNIDNIYEDLPTQLSYAVGTPARLAIQKAYAYSQVRLCAAGLGVISLCIVWTLMIKNINVGKIAQVKGMLF